VPVVAVEWGASLGYHHTTIGRALRRLEAAGVVERVGDRWRTVLPPVDHAERADKSVTSDNCAYMHTPVSYSNSDQTVIRSETELKTTATQQQRTITQVQTLNRNEDNDKPTIDDDRRYAHRQACRGYVWLVRPVAGWQRRYPLTEVAAAHADEIDPGWHLRRWSPTLADEVRAVMRERGKWRSNARDGAWSAGALLWALRCVAEDRAAENVDDRLDDRLDDRVDDRLDAGHGHGGDECRYSCIHDAVDDRNATRTARP